MARLTTPTLTPAQLHAELGLGADPGTVRRARRHDEADLQRAVVSWLELAVPREACRWFHVPNGEKRDRLAAAILVGMGVDPGVPDLVFLLPAGRTLSVELKAPDGRGGLSDAQRDFHAAATALEHPVVVARSIDDVARALRAHGVPVLDARAGRNER